ncbi:iron complex transport system permease protein [Saccharopolyspora kobensis]|uniref:Iron complex transport system permease protein n=1 Tax=Saccharopolyspora kobensis TaxID=146035 RepID=A0A1H6EIE2_9PSEU|nr:iron ABC transporter permease [Saccharopolyspora kobensis]SEG97630.1 iron complex transport system permease protein [Saccharopolyspora kobensis]SFE93101.1 iron complex transport system permease protein [Saccharopolyspora kobensis]
MSGSLAVDGPRAAEQVAPGGARLRERRRRRLIGIAVLVVALLVSCVLSVVVGAKTIPLTEVWSGLFQPTGTENDLIIRELRVPRTIVGVLAGAALGLAGALMQGHTRNPIADPGILGITQGAALGVVLAIYTFSVTTLVGFIWFGFAGAMLGALAVFAIGSIGRGGPTPVTLALAGTAISFLLQAITSALVLTDQQTMDTYRFWKVGSIAVTDPSVIPQVLPFVLIGMVLALTNAGGLNALSLGEDVARSLGHRVEWSRRAGIAAIAVLVGSAVAICGPIGFVGLIVPHVARFFTGADYRWLLPFAGLLGAALVLLADVLGRIVARPSEVQVGVMLAMVGAPFFIALVRRRKMVRL